MDLAFYHPYGAWNFEMASTMCPTRYQTRLAGGPLIRVATIRRTADTFIFISHTTNVLPFKFRCNIFIGVRIIKEMPGSVASGTRCRCFQNLCISEPAVPYFT